MEKTAVARAVGPKPVAPGAAAEQQTTGSSPLEPQPGGGTEEKMEQSVCGVATEGEKASTDKTVNPTKGRLDVCSSLQLDACSDTVRDSTLHYHTRAAANNRFYY